MPAKKCDSLQYNFLIIGSGIAGLNFALQASKYGTVAIVTKKELMESNSNYAQGGIAAVLDKYDSFDKHIEDTLKAGCYLNDKKAVELMIKQAPKEIKRLVDLGVGFSKQQNKLCLSKEGGHSANRIAHAHDTTGKEIERALIHQVRHNKNIDIFESHMAFKLLVRSKDKACLPARQGISHACRQAGNNMCIGASVFDTEKGKIIPFLAKATILATGGAGQVYLRNSNPKIATGDGIAMAHEIGAEIRDMEFIQFHPTALDLKNKPALLISETVRGEGGCLVNGKGEKFMKKYHKLGDLAPRDIVSRAIFEELKNGKACPESNRRVYLDIRHKGSAFIKKRFPYLYESLWWYGIKMDKDLIPVAPAAHFVCGGVHTNLNGETGIPGLFAFGEVAHTGVHGANRLASNSLLECMVFSGRAVDSTKKYMEINKLQDTSYKIQTNLKLQKSNTKQIMTVKKQIQELMWKNVGIVRETKKLKLTLEKMNTYYTQIEKEYGKGVNREIIELKNLCLSAILITQASLERKESVGCHFIEK
ncbi:L-aspartate oxidase [Patescibacteria group bacterium]|nr:L-aspartate oxidase [Patescibacteria group bacterium]